MNTPGNKTGRMQKIYVDSLVGPTHVVHGAHSVRGYVVTEEKR